MDNYKEKYNITGIRELSNHFTDTGDELML